MLAIDKLIEGIRRTGNPTAVGLDTHLGLLPEGFAGEVRSLSDAAQAIERYNVALVDALYDIAPCVKVQAAYYEMYGPAGMQAFYNTLCYAAQKGMTVIADAKRGDIGATASAYASAYLGKTAVGEAGAAAFPCDLVTVNPYLGVDSIQPFLDAGKERGGGIFVLVKTSNPSGVQLQDLTVADGRKVYEVMADYAAQWGEQQMGKYGYANVGAVVGATYPEQGAALRQRLPHTFFLVPGYGAQGATGKDLKGCFDQRGEGAVVNASRSLLTAYRKRPHVDFAQAARDEAIRMRDDIQGGLLG